MKNNHSDLFLDQRKKCPICTSYDYTYLLKLPYNFNELSNYLTTFYGAQGYIELEFLQNGHYSLCRCTNCEGIFQEYIPNDFLMDKLYEEWISPEKAFVAHTEKIASLDLNYKKEITSIHEAFFRNNDVVKVLDFGMGWGRWAQIAKKIGWDVCGTELSKSRIQYSQKQGIETINLDSNPYKFDFINTEQVFEHLPNPLTTLTTLRHCLKGEGIIKISVPTAKNIEERLEKMDWNAPKSSKTSLNPVAPLEHINFFRRGSLLKMAHLAGLEEIKIPMRVQYKNIEWSGSMKQLIKKSIQPVRLNYRNDFNYLFFRKY